MARSRSSNERSSPLLLGRESFVLASVTPKPLWMMRRFSHRLLASPLLIVGLVVGVLAWAPSTMAQVRINEVDYSDKWVELYNTGTSSVNVSNYHLCTYPTYQDLATLTGQSTVTMNAGEFLVVDWDPLSNNAGDPDGEVGLYVDGDRFTDHTDMVDYMEFGESGHFRESVAVDAGEWQSGEFVSLAPSGKTLSYFGMTGEVGQENWDASNETKGAPNDLIPVELARFEATTHESEVQLTWETASETSNAGFEIQHRSPGSPFEAHTFVDGHGTTSTPHRYRHVVGDLKSGRHIFRLRQVDLDGSSSLSHPVEAIVAPRTGARLAVTGPMPAAPTTEVSLTVRKTQPVTVRVYDLLGRRVMTVYDGSVTSGAPRRVRVDGHPLTSGRYVLRATGATFVTTHPLVVGR